MEKRTEELPALSLNPERKQKSNDAEAHVGRRIRMRRVWPDMPQIALG